MELDIKAYKFSDLTIDILYEILRLRSEIFVVEQTCVYQDIDGLDQSSWHVVGMVDESIIAYARIIPRTDSISIGRVLVQKDYRGKSFGNKLMIHCLKLSEKILPGKTITLSSQKHLTHFYEELGFKVEGKPYLEDGIPHISMTRIAI